MYMYTIEVKIKEADSALDRLTYAYSQPEMLCIIKNNALNVHKAGLLAW